MRDGAMLHDVGKVAIPNEILFKPGPLDARRVGDHARAPGDRRAHPARTPELAPIAPLVRHEHERWDGGGYPDGLRGDEIPIGSRIILACDAYNAMITARPYREPMSAEAAVARARARTPARQFDPTVVDALLAVLADASRCTRRRLRRIALQRSTPSREDDLAELLPLMRGYCDFYEVAPSDDALLALSRALIADPEREGLQLIARDDDGRALGFATIFWTWSTLSAVADRGDERPVRGRRRARQRARPRR